jgi:Na+-translocating ferredoxin:NAD+ oxidoreductase RnfD subunit
MPDLPTIPAEVPVKLAYAPSLVGARPILWHSGVTLPKFFSLHLMGALFPVLAGFMLYGWRALLLMALVMAAATLSFIVWRRIDGRGGQLRLSHTLWFSLLLSLMLPVHLMTTDRPFEDSPSAQWSIAAAAGMLLVILTWLLGGVGSGRVHPVLVTYLLLIVLFKQALVPHWVLQKDHLFLGDARKAERVESAITSTEGWIKTDAPHGWPALYEDAASEKLYRFTSGQPRQDRSWVAIDALLRDEMPPLEDLIIGGEPGPVGTTSAVAVIVGGLFLLYRGVVDFRIPLLIYVAALVGLLVLPVPAVIREVVSGGINQRHIDWRWLALRSPDIGVARALTLANYEILAGPLLFMALFLATAPAVRPMARRARIIYAILIGLLAAFLQLYISVSFGPYMALLLVSLLTPTFDKMFRPRPLV